MKHSDRQSELELELTRYLDGQLSRRRAVALERRLLEDAALRRELQRYAALEGYLAAMGHDVPEGVDYDAQRGEIVAAAERRVLLSGAPRRRLVFRGPLTALAAAAAVAILLAAGWLMRPATPAPVVQAMVLPAEAQARGEVALVVEYPQLTDDELPLAPAGRREARPGLPPGTVAVSFGRVRDRAEPAEAMIYPGLLE